MSLRYLKLRSWRNIEEAELCFHGSTFFFVGANGEGKTSLLEAIYYLCFGVSFRTHDENTLICSRAEQRSFQIEASWEDHQLKHRLRSYYSPGEKKIEWNGQKIPDRSFLLEEISCVLYSYDDIHIVKPVPSRRRIFFDQTFSLLETSYVTLWRNFYRVLKQRNAAFKKSLESLVAYDVLYVEALRALVEKRKDMVDAFNEELQLLKKDIPFLEGIELVYKPSLNSHSIQEALDFLEERRSSEERRNNSLWGAHRDSYLFLKEGLDIGYFFSTGEIRFFSLLLRTIQARLLYRLRQRKPLLLLDDVLLEMDESRRRLFWNVLPDYEQAFFTFLPHESLGDYQDERTLFFDVSHGQFYPR